MIRRRLNAPDVSLLRNDRRPGVGAAWNVGLEEIHRAGRGRFVAILDDDDDWDPDHLEVNLEAAIGERADVVISGLRIHAVGGEVSRPLIGSLSDRDFLTGNPGWQGSNSFVALSTLVAVGGFRESLRCLHDRDVAIRILRSPGVRMAFVPRWTATWRADRTGRLSDRRGQAKLEGLRQFWALYAGEMSESERDAYLHRADSLFGFSAAEICATPPQLSPRPSIRGDLRVPTKEQL